MYNFDIVGFTPRDRNFIMEMGGTEAIIQVPAHQIKTGDILILENFSKDRIREVLAREKPMGESLVSFMTYFNSGDGQVDKRSMCFGKDAIVTLIRPELGDDID